MIFLPSSIARYLKRATDFTSPKQHQPSMRRLSLWREIVLNYSSILRLAKSISPQSNAEWQDLGVDCSRTSDKMHLSIQNQGRKRSLVLVSNGPSDGISHPSSSSFCVTHCYRLQNWVGMRRSTPGSRSVNQPTLKHYYKMLRDKLDFSQLSYFCFFAI